MKEPQIGKSSWSSRILVMENIEAVAEMLTPMVRLMVDRPDEVSVETIMDGLGVMYRIHVSPLDRGKLIGQGGRTARSMRVILQAVSMTQKIKVNLDIAE
jgi:predicted RNA-binding protein YlqC (UPF0109 family)